jgi:glycosyltransferase involved in cell wall biosynthesis
MVDLLHVKGHGPYLERTPENLRIVELGSSHAISSLIPLVSYLRKAKPDVLLSDKYRVNRIALLASKISRIPINVFVRMGTTVSIDLESRKTHERWMEKHFIRLLYPWSKAVLTPSKAAARDFTDYTGLPENLVKVVRSPVATPEFHEKAKANADHPWFLKKTDPVIVGIGELSGRKDFETLIHAFAAHRKRRPAKLVIIGKGRRRELLETLVAELGIKEDVYFSGFLQNPYPYLAKADLYVHSSRWEGAPVALIEAVALGIPVVSTDCPSGPREILQDGLFGKLVPVGDDKAMGQAMSATLENPPDPGHTVLAANPYTLESSTNEHIDILGLNQDKNN